MTNVWVYGWDLHFHFHTLAAEKSTNILLFTTPSVCVRVRVCLCDCFFFFFRYSHTITSLIFSLCVLTADPPASPLCTEELKAPSCVKQAAAKTGRK